MRRLPSSSPLHRCLRCLRLAGGWGVFWLVAGLMAAAWGSGTGLATRAAQTVAALSAPDCALKAGSACGQSHDAASADDRAADPTPATDLADLAGDFLRPAGSGPRGRAARRRLPAGARWRSCGQRRRKRPPRAA